MTMIGWPSSQVQSVVAPPIPVPGLDAHETYASVSLLGQFRTNICAWLWVRADLYFHNGTEMRPESDVELRSGRSAESQAKDTTQLDRFSEVTVVPPADRDFRGIIGDVERAVKTYRDMHNHRHNDANEALPLFRLMTWVDPHFVPAYTMEGTILLGDGSSARLKKSLQVLNEGLQENPESLELLEQIGATRAYPGRDLTGATPPLLRAITLGVAHFKTLDSDQSDALLQSFRWLGLCYRNEGLTEEMAATAAQGLKYFANDPVLAHLEQTPPTLLTNKGAALWRTEHPVDRPAAPAGMS